MLYRVMAAANLGADRENRNGKMARYGGGGVGTGSGNVLVSVRIWKVAANGELLGSSA
jgi:hypothetical protein